MAKSAFTQMKKTSLLSDLLAVLIWFPILLAQVGTVIPEFREAVSEPQLLCQQPQPTPAGWTPHVLKHTKASSSTPALHSTQGTPQYRCSGR